MSLIHRCMDCGGQLHEETRLESRPIKHDGRPFKVDVEVVADVCSECGHVTYSGNVSALIRRALRAKLGLLQPETIRRLRGTHSQQFVAELTGIAPETWSRLENDKGVHSRSTDRLLRAMFALPSLFHSESVSHNSCEQFATQRWGGLPDLPTAGDAKVRDEELSDDDRPDPTYSLAA